VFRDHGFRVDFHVLVGMIQVFIPGLLAEALRFSFQEDRVIGFWQGEDAQDEDREGPYCFDVFCPAPAEPWSN